MPCFIKMYYNMCLAVGLINIHYDRRTESLHLYHWPTIAYTGIHNLLAVLFQPFAIIGYFHTMYFCEEFDALAIMNGILSVCYGMSTVVTILEAWLKRKRFQQLCYGYGMLVQRYLNDAKINENREVVAKTRHILFRKLLSSVCKSASLYVHLYNGMDDEECSYMDDMHYIISTVYLGFLNAMLICLDINVIMGLLLIDLCLGMLINSLDCIGQEIKLMSRVYAKGYEENQKRQHQKWRWHLSKDVENIICDVRKLLALAREHIEIYQVPMMFMLLSMFMGLISSMFHFLSYIDDWDNSKPITLIFLLILLLANISNAMILFSVCESLTENFKKMSQLVYEISLYASLMNKGMFYGDPLEMSLDSLAMQLRRQRFKVSICGLFEINHRAGMTMLSKMILNLLFLVQSVVKSVVDQYNQFYNDDDEYDEDN